MNDSSGSSSQTAPEVRQVEAGPQVGSYGILASWRFFDVVWITRVTDQQVRYRRAKSTQECRAYKTKLLAWGLDKDAADNLCNRLTSAKAECNRREAAARKWFADEQAKIIARAKGQPA